jgi:hypothetical protein
MTATAIGFTGTQTGMTDAQRATLHRLLSDRARTGPAELHHGDCVGADAEAHLIATRLQIPVVLHPPTDPSRRAFCAPVQRSFPPRPYLERNHGIVEATTVLVATPSTATERRRSGTWATVRYARKRGHSVIVVNPDGTLALSRIAD